MSIEWNGEGLPPVGCDCEVNDERTDSWSLVDSVLAHACVHGRDVAVFQIADYIGYSPTDRFRPIRTEAERKRDEKIACLDNFIGGFMKSTGGDHAHLGEAIYEWLAVLDRLK